MNCNFRGGLQFFSLGGAYSLRGHLHFKRAPVTPQDTMSFHHFYFRQGIWLILWWCLYCFLILQSLTNFVMKSKEWWWSNNWWVSHWWRIHQVLDCLVTDHYHASILFFSDILCHNLRWNLTNDGGRVIDGYHIEWKFTKCWISW